MNEELVNEILAKLEVQPNDIAITSYRTSRKACSWSNLLSSILAVESLKEVADSLGYTPDSLKKYMVKYIGPIINKTAKTNWKTSFLSIINKRQCSKCKGISTVEDYSTDNSTYDKLRAVCRSCDGEYAKAYVSNNRYKVSKYRHSYYIINKEHITEKNHRHYLNNKYLYVAKSAKRRALKLQATPNWANQEKIKEMYKNCPEGSHVDHWAPLQGELVCGLHCEFNLQYLTAAENLAKSNKFEIC